jgi:spore coat polysaccharide biosynthesis protein SpsF
VKLLVVVQARMSSTRLPGKVLLPLAGEPLLSRMLQRLRAARSPFELCVATTAEPQDEPIAKLAERAGIACMRGHPSDLLDRHVQAARVAGADAVAKIPSDCPLIDPAVVDRVLGAFLEDPSVDYVSNLHPATWPDGYDVEVMTTAALEVAHREATRTHEREHTTPFLWDQPGRFRVKNVAWERDLQMSHRFTIDYPEDYAFIRTVFEALHREDEAPFGLEAILSYLDRHPEVFALNQKYAGVNWYRHHLGELRTIDASQTRFPPSS